MSQETLRRFNAVLVLAVAIIFGVTIGAMVKASLLEMRFLYSSELMRRVIGVSTMLKGLPETMWPNSTLLTVVSHTLPFVLTSEDGDLVGGGADSPAQVLFGPNGLITVRLYVPEESVTLSLSESVQGTLFLSPSTAYKISGVCLLFTTIVLHGFFFQAGNVLARRSRRWMGYMAVVASHILLLVGAVALPCVMDRVAREYRSGRIAEWQSHTLNLYLGVFSAAMGQYPSRIPASLFPAMMIGVSSQAFFLDDYSMHVVNKSSQTVIPSLGRPEVESHLLDIARSGFHGAYRDVERGEEFLIACQPDHLNHVFIVTLWKQMVSQPLSSPLSRQLLLFCSIPTAVVVVVALIMTPYPSLGVITSPAPWYSPWEWRAWKYLPQFQAIHAATLLSLTVGIASCLLLPVAAYSTTPLKQQLESVIQMFGQVSLRGRVVGETYTNIAKSIAWDGDIFALLPDIPMEDLVRINTFYQQLFLVIGSMPYEPSSIVAALGAEEVTALPLLTQQAAVIEIVNKYELNSLRLSYLIALWDYYYSVHFFLASVDGLRDGPTNTTVVVVNKAIQLGDAATGAVMNDIIAATLESATSYAHIAETLSKSPYDASVVRSTFGTSDGAAARYWEDTLLWGLLDLIPQVSLVAPPQGTLSLTVIVNYSIYLGIMAMVTVGAHAMWSAVYVRLMFTMPTTKEPVIASNDVTDYRLSLDNLDGPGVTRRARWSAALNLAVVVSTVATLCITWRLALDVVMQLDGKWVAMKAAVPSGVSLASSAASIVATSSLWIRAALSHNVSDISAAISRSAEWEKIMARVQVKDGMPSGVANMTTRDEVDPVTQPVWTLARSIMDISRNTIATSVVGNTLYDDLVLIMSSRVNALNDTVGTLLDCVSDTVAHTTTKALLDFNIAQIYGAERGEFQRIYTVINDVVQSTGLDCPAVAATLLTALLSMQREEAILRRSNSIASFLSVASGMQNAADRAAQLIFSQARAVPPTIANLERTLISVINTWLPILITWLCTIFVWITWRLARESHRLAYFS